MPNTRKRAAATPVRYREEKEAKNLQKLKTKSDKVDGCRSTEKQNSKAKDSETQKLNKKGE